MFIVILAFLNMNTFFLIHWGLVTPFGNIELGQYWLR